MKGRIGELLRNSKDDILLSYDLIRMRSDLIHNFNINILKKLQMCIECVFNFSTASRKNLLSKGKTADFIV